ncbi:DUF2809 domain-containing protein [Actinoplanes sp. NEAU-A12]|uniref:DUF2809 domain-containing protein n=1 Tax=Actinoplanes sandaracinus TaxID=3045177 RepID=A0ABT6WF57_9ACTN|nr:DUF2809 domain-containing protein [Actinoplanes sandaracinus]MDI6098342.1 DUF2809 domain-containing protein [Actinoplanes sandaracinus]
MSISHARFRLAMLGAAAAVVTVALAIRAVAPIGGWLEQSSGTALYASMVYAGVLFLAPRLSPVKAGAITLTWCWGVELGQLTGIPAALSAESLAARMILGAAFDPADLLRYPLGVIPLVVVHQLRRTPGTPGAGPGHHGSPDCR